MNDISNWYDADKALAAEVDWILARPNEKIIHWLLPRIDAAGVNSIIEFGCGSGMVAAVLPPDARYVGVDANQHFLRMAKARCPERTFLKQDVREFEEARVFDLAMAWSLFKHFAIKEWNAIVACVLVHGKFGCFNVQMFGRDMDDGRDYHHVYVTEARLAEAIRGAGHEEVERLVLKEWEFSGAMAKDVVVWTKQKETSNATH